MTFIVCYWYYSDKTFEDVGHKNKAMLYYHAQNVFVQIHHYVSASGSCNKIHQSCFKTAFIWRLVLVFEHSFEINPSNTKNNDIFLIIYYNQKQLSNDTIIWYFAENALWQNNLWGCFPLISTCGEWSFFCTDIV